MEQTLGARAGGKQADRGAACGMTEDRDVIRIAAEGCRIAAHPLQAGDQILDAVGAGSVPALATEFRMRHVAIHTEAIGQADNYCALVGQGAAVIHRDAGGTAHIAAAVYPHNHRQLCGGRARRSPDVQIQTVFTDRSCVALCVGRLHAGIGKTVDLANAGPRRNRYWRLPAQRTHRRSGEGNALEDGQTALVNAADLTACDLDRRDLRHDGRGGPRRRHVVRRAQKHSLHRRNTPVLYLEHL